MHYSLRHDARDTSAHVVLFYFAQKWQQNGQVVREQALQIDIVHSDARGIIWNATIFSVYF